MTADELRAAIALHLDPFHAALLQHAATFAGQRGVKSVPAASEWRKRERPRQGQCYRNAQSFCIHGGTDASYYEGYWSSGAGSPVQHAWAVLAGEVIDFTAEAGNRLLQKMGLEPHDPAASVYCGMHVPTRFLLDHMLLTRGWLPVAADYLNSLGIEVEHPSSPILFPPATLSTPAEVR